MTYEDHATGSDDPQPTLFDMGGGEQSPLDTSTTTAEATPHSGRLAPEEGQEVPSTEFDKTSLREAHDRGLIGDVPESPRALTEGAPTTADSGSDTGRTGVFNGLLDSRRNKITAIGASVAVVAGIGAAIAATRGGNTPSKHPVAATQPKVPAQTRATKAAVAAPSPSDLPSVAAKTPTTANSPTVTSPNTAPAASEVQTTPANNAEILAKLKTFINPAQVDALKAQYGSELTDRMNLSLMDSAEKQAVLSKQKIGAYQQYIRKVYANKKVAEILGDPQGWIDADVMTGMPADAMGKLIVSTTDSFLNTVAQKVQDPMFNKTPGINTGLVDLATLSPFSRSAEKNTIAQGADSYTYATDASIVAVTTVTMPDGSAHGYKVDIVETVADYSDGSKRFTASELVPVGAVTPDLSDDAILSLQIYRQTLGQ